MNKLTLRLKYSPHDKQREFHDLDNKFRAFVAGVGSGKSLAGVMEVIKHAVKYPKTSWVIVAPSYRMLKDATLKSFEEFCPKELIQNHVRGEKRYELINGSQIWYRSGDDPESLRGPNLHGFFVDEAALCKKSVWDILLGRIRATGAPNRGWLATTPKGFDWIYRMFVKEQAGNPDYGIVYASSLQNPHLPDDFVVSLKSSYSGTFYEQEVMGQFRAHDGVVYRNFNRAIHEVAVEGVRDAYANVNDIGGIDWGYANPMVALIILRDHDDRLHVAGEVYRARMTIEEFSTAIKDEESRVSEKIGRGLEVKYYADPSDIGLGTGSLADQLRQQGHNIQKANNTVMTGINAVMTRLEDAGDGRPRLFVDPSCVNTLSEFETYSFEEPDETRPTKDKPIKQNDHAMDALRYAVMSLQSGDRVVVLGGGDVLF